MLDAILRLAKDPIPNIRFNVAKTLEVIAGVLATMPTGKQLAVTKIGPVLKTLQNDPDADVRYFANKAIMGAQL